MSLWHPPSEPMQVRELPKFLSHGFHSIQVPVGQKVEQEAGKGPMTSSVKKL